tara:strand:- start:89 stop:526 length:438 start_codon:yes stop_codon:yes gene_type:complete
VPRLLLLLLLLPLPSDDDDDDARRSIARPRLFFDALDDDHSFCSTERRRRRRSIVVVVIVEFEVTPEAPPTLATVPLISLSLYFSFCLFFSRFFSSAFFLETAVWFARPPCLWVFLAGRGLVTMLLWCWCVVYGDFLFFFLLFSF